MSEESEWSESQKRERTLLRRCREFVLGGPASPGGGPKDVLYLTPCGRWLRVYSGAIEYGDPAWGATEVSSRINSRKAAVLFDQYNWPRPAELNQPDLKRDLEVAADLRSSLLLNSHSTSAAFPCPRKNGEFRAVERLARRRYTPRACGHTGSLLRCPKGPYPTQEHGWVSLIRLVRD